MSLLVPAGFFTPFPLGIPTLILTGEDDPVAPPLYGNIIAGLMVNSLYVIVPRWAHGFSAETPW